MLLLSLVETFHVAADISSSAVLLACFVNGNVALLGFYHTEHSLLAQHLVTAETFTERYVLSHIVLLSERLTLKEAAFGLYVNLEACKSCCKLCVLTLVADSERKLIIGNDNRAGSYFLVGNVNADNICGL